MCGLRGFVFHRIKRIASQQKGQIRAVLSRRTSKSAVARQALLQQHSLAGIPGKRQRQSVFARGFVGMAELAEQRGAHGLDLVAARTSEPRGALDQRHRLASRALVPA